LAGGEETQEDEAPTDMTLLWIAIALLILWIVTLEGRILAAFKRIEEDIEELEERCHRQDESHDDDEPDSL
jgi:hypothetical protein